MNTGKQINAMVLFLFVLAIVSGVYALWDQRRADNAEADQLEVTAERAATTFALNCRVCHGDRGQGGALGGRLPEAPPLDRDDLEGIEEGVFSKDSLERAFSFVSHTITCGRIGTKMPTWGQAQGGVLNEEQIRQLTVLITAGDPKLGLHKEGGFWELAQEHADELDAEAAQHAEVDMPDGVFAADATTLTVNNAAPFTAGQYIRIQDERLRVQPKAVVVQRGIAGTEAVEHEVGTPLLRVDGDTEDTGETLTAAVADDTATLFEVTSARRFAPGDVLQLDDERVRVEAVQNGVPTTYQTLVEDIGREPETLILSGSENVEPDAVIRLGGELMRVRDIRDAGDIGEALDGDISPSDTRISVSDASIFEPEYVARIDDEHIRVVAQINTDQLLGGMIGRAETTFTVSGTEGLQEGMVIRIGTELIRIAHITRARVQVQRQGPAAHAAGAALELANPNEGEDSSTGQTLLQPVGTDETTFVVSGTSGIAEGDTFVVGDEQFKVREGGIQPASLRVERGVRGSEKAAHAARVPIYEGNLVDVERGVEGTAAASHNNGATMYFTEITVKRELEGTKVQDHARTAEAFLGNDLIVDRGVAVPPGPTTTEAAEHQNGELVRAFPLAPQAEPNNGEACGYRRNATEPTPSGPTPTPAANAPTVTVALAEYTVTPDAASVPAGAVSFQVSNDGSIDHNFRVIKTDLASDQLPISAGAVDEASPDLQVDASTPDFGAGESQTANVDLEPGSYVLICNFPGHYLSGMHIAFTVTQ
ncbi:MAG: hypothetical protein WBD55_12315 [Dehalococcoidia bacterium]